jgi:hypothetical protein
MYVVTDEGTHIPVEVSLSMLDEDGETELQEL